MESLVFINTSNATATAGLEGARAPDVRAKLQATWIGSFAFHDGTGEDPVVLTGATFRFGIKLVADGDPFAYASVVTLDNSGAFPVYDVVITSVDAAALRDAIRNTAELSCIGEIEWTIAGVRQRAAFPVTIVNAWLRQTDGPPDPEADASDAFVAARAVCYDRVQTLLLAAKWRALNNLGFTFVNGGLRFLTPGGDVVYLSANSGEPPAP